MSLTKILLAAALMQTDYPRGIPRYSTGASAKKPHDPERIAAAVAKRARRAARKEAKP